jgi:hypothetical protein
MGPVTFHSTATSSAGRQGWPNAPGSMNRTCPEKISMHALNAPLGGGGVYVVLPPYATPDASKNRPPPMME